MLPKSTTVAHYLGQSFTCACGCQHTTALRDVLIGSGVLAQLPDLLQAYGCSKPLVVSDRHTHQAAGNQVVTLLQQAGLAPHTHQFIRQEELVPDEPTLGELLMACPTDTDCLVAVGTGTINDLCKYLSFRLGLPYLVVATAPSMDGFASIGAALITDHLKTTYDTRVPLAIIGDVEILKEAPMAMITAGLGDILGKYTCLADWKLAHIITGEYYCQDICAMVESSIARVVDNAQRVLQRDPAAVGAIMEALVLTGIAMSFVGNSRPASGSEHHISHYWEMQFLLQGRKAVLHGTKVGIGTVLSCWLYNHLQTLQPDFAYASQAAADFDQAIWEKTIRRTFCQAADGVIALEAKTQKNGLADHAKRLEIIQREWPRIVATAQAAVPTTQQIIDLLASLGAPTYPAQEQVDSQTVFDGVVVAKEVRNRYTILQLLWDLGLLETQAEQLVDWLQDK